MVSYICIVFLLILTMLAIISRKNYSKYKDGVKPLWWIALWLTSHLGDKSRIREYIKRTKPLNTKALSEETDRRIAVFIHDTLRILVVFLLILCIAGLIPEKEVDLYTIERPDIGEDSTFVDVRLIDKGTQEQELYSLEVSPREYTKEEFDELSDRVRAYLDSVILGNNKSPELVTEDLFFPTTYENTGLRIVWETDMPTVLGSDGRIVADDLDDKVKVNISAKIKDANFSSDYETSVLVSKEEILSSSDKAKVAMLNIERENRTGKEFTIPHELDDVSIERNIESREDKLLYVLIFGFIIIGLLGYYRVYKLKETGEMRDEEIGDAYYGFANRLAIYIGAGFTLRKSLEAAIKNEKSEFLTNEVEYTLNMTAAGIPETKAYMELGNRLGIEEYMRLMSLISQNLSFGNSNLLKLLDTEVKTSFFLKKERVRKKGEQASEKLLIPTAILLIIVIIVVMYPAFIGMR